MFHILTVFFLFSMSALCGFKYDEAQSRLDRVEYDSIDGGDEQEIRLFIMAALKTDEERMPIHGAITPKMVSDVKALFEHGRTFVTIEEIKPLIVVEKKSVKPGFCRRVMRGAITCVVLLGGYFAVEYGLAVADARLAAWIASGIATLVSGFSFALIGSLIQPSTAKFAQWGYQAVAAADDDGLSSDSQIAAAWQEQFWRTNQKAQWTQEAGRNVLASAKFFVNTTLGVINSQFNGYLLRDRRDVIPRKMVAFMVGLMRDFRFIFSLDVPFGRYAGEIRENFELYEGYLPGPRDRAVILQKLEDAEGSFFDRAYYEKMLDCWFPFLMVTDDTVSL